jgi:hypothetical protein
MLLKIIIEALLVTLLVITVVSQIIIPAFTNREMFWFFKKEIPSESGVSTLNDLNKEVDQAVKTKNKVNKVADQVKKMQEKI